MNDKCCGNCKFFLSQDSKVMTYSTGDCRRYPPIPTGSGTRFPYVEKTDWCGEYQKIQDSQ